VKITAVEASTFRSTDKGRGPAIEGVPDPIAGRIRPSEAPGLGLSVGAAFEPVS
jgi:hypothetical protein